MLDQVDKKLNTEATTQYEKVIADYLRSKCELDESICVLVLDESKKVSKCFEVIKNTAKTKAHNGCYAMPDDEVFRLVDKYYGIINGSSDIKPIKPPVREVIPDKQIKKPKDKEENLPGQMSILDFL